MINPPSFIPAKPFAPRRRRRAPVDAAPPQELILVAADFTDEELLTLTFDRAVDATGIDGQQIIVDDSIIVGSMYVATGTATMLSPTTVRIAMEWFEGTTTPGLHLTASASNGIVAVDDGGTWVGVTNLEMPFP